MKRIGILALQGAFIEHENAIRFVYAKNGSEFSDNSGTNSNAKPSLESSAEIDTKFVYDFEITQIRKSSDFNPDLLDALIIPGGESTVQGKLLHELGLFNSIKHAIQDGMPVLGTCAGLLLLAKNIESENVATADKMRAGGEEKYLATMSVTAKRNAFGRQLGSFFARGDFLGTKIPMTFIRAPYILHADKDVEILSTIELNGHDIAVAARQGNQLVTAFHPELTDNTMVHEYFLRMLHEDRSELQ